MNTLTSINHALSDPNRIRLLMACHDRERCVCQLVELIDQSNASISKHLAQLKASGLLTSRREGRWVHYRTPESPTPMVRDAIEMVCKHASQMPEIAQDIERLKRIDEIDPCDLAQMQRKNCCSIFRSFSSKGASKCPPK